MKRYVWYVGVDMYLLMDMKEDKPVGSILPQKEGSCIIRWGHHVKEEPMHEELIDPPKYTDDPFDVIMYAAGAIEAKLWISNDHDSIALIDHVCRLREEERRAW